MKVALCVIGRLENRYAIEFVEYYKKLGIDHIYIGDNNNDGEEYFEDVLQSYIDGKYVTIIGIRNSPNTQEYYYSWFYDVYHNIYDYIIYVDFDEYLTLVKDKTIKEYLSRNVNNYDIIKLNWMLYTDNDLIYDDGRPCLERFTEPMYLYNSVSVEFPENCHIKSIIRCKFNKILFDGPHMLDTSYLTSGYKICNGSFKETNDLFYEYNIDYSLAYIKHFFTKTIDEYVNIKKIRGTIEGGQEDFNRRYKGRFFKVNKLTPEKEKYCLEHNIDINLL